MAFPEDPLGLRTDLLLDGVWTDITKDVYTRAPITHQRGIRNEGAVADPASVPITINNKSGKYSNRNPMSPYYGLIGRNTRVRLSLPGEESYLQLDGSPTGYASTPDTAALDLTKDIDLRWEGEADWYARGAQMLIGKWGEAGQRSYHMRLEDGLLCFHGTTDGTVGGIPQTALPAGLPRRAAVRTVLVGGTTCRWYWAESLDGPWTQFDELLLSNPFPDGVFVSTAPLVIAPSQVSATVNRLPAAGRVYRAEVRGAGATVVASPDFRGQPAGAGGFTDSAGRAWTLTGTAEIRDRVDRFIGEISEWPQKWVPSEADAWVPVQAAGILRRLGRGTKPVDSALRHRIPSYEPMAYWPMEEGQDATKAYSPIAGIDPLSFTQANWAADSSLPSSAPLPTVGSQSGNLSFMSGMVRNYSWANLDTWEVIWMYHMPQVPSARQTFMLVRSTGTVRDWYIQMGPDDSRILGLDREGVTVVDRTIATGVDIFGEWIKARFTVQQEGSNVRWYMSWQDIDGDAGNVSNTFAGISGRPTGVFSPPGGYSANLQGLAMGHISVWDKVDPGAYDNAMNAWSGETAGDRMLRMAAEEGIPVTLTGAPANTDPVGYQKLSPVLDLVRAAADADGGLLTEDQTALRLLYRPRSTLYSQTPALVLDYAQGQIAAPLEPVDDDTNIRNDVTVTRDQGGATRVVLASGPLSVLDPPDGVGVYDDSVTLSLATDEQTVGKAYWELHLGTWDEPRYPAVTINLHRHPELIPAVLALREGDVIRLVNMPEWVAPDDVDLMVQGFKEQLLPRTWTITYDCRPAGPWQVGATDDAALGRVDTDGSQLAAAVDADDTVLPVTVTAGPWWIGGGAVLNPNPRFTTDLADWTGFGATIERVEAPTPKPFAGTWAMRLTPGGVEQYPNAGSGQVPVMPGRQYTLSGWLRCATPRSVALNLNWFDAAAGYLATSANDQPVLANTWTWFEMTATAPAGAATANLAPTVADYPPAADVLWAHQLTLRPQTDGAKLADFPFDVRAGGEVMTVDSVMPTVADRFTRTVAGGWGTTETGQAWTATGGVPADFEVGGGVAQHTISTKNVYRITSLNGVALADVDMMVSVRLPSTPTGDGIYTYYLARANVSSGVFYFARLYFQTSSTVELSLRKRTPDETALATSPILLPFVAGLNYRLRFQMLGSTLRAKAWALPDVEPADWHVTATDTSITAAGAVGVRTYASTSNTNSSPLVIVDNLAVGPHLFGVTRSVNGVVKAQSAATDVRLANPMRLAL
ncbi:hypothetical protein [Streptomyces sp. NPDC059402]|uniref:hypothetical protein n=1 Tax=Streptomyces sp. NPDC059402 TaxID=3346822 RepID=UPI00367CE757